MRDNPKVSVIVPTYRDSDKLLACVKGLKNQSYPSDVVELIVVNNCPASSLPEEILCDKSISLMEESGAGSYAARNKGLANATGDIIAFTDADCIPHACWLEEGVRLIKEGHHRVAGNVELVYEEGSLSIPAIYEKAFAFRQAENAAQGVSVTANLFVLASLFESLGPFDSSLMSGGDFEWNTRARNAGAGIVYSELAAVSHPARATWRELLTKWKRVSIGGYEVHGLSLQRILVELLPPLDAGVRLIKERRLSFTEVIVATLVRYFLKLYRLSIFARQALRKWISGEVKPGRSEGSCNR